MSIDMDSIMGKVKTFSESPEGKRRIKACLEKYEKEGRNVTEAGSKLMTKDVMYEAADKLISILQATARDMDLPDSVLAHFDSLGHTMPFKQQDGSTVMCIYFDDDLYNGLHRDSLQPDKWSGVDNIIAVLNNGYDKSEGMAKVWGVWHGMHVHALTERTGLRFIQKAVNDFNSKYGLSYNVTARIGEKYE